MKKKKQDNKGFTLIELVIVVAILAILIGILAPQYTKYVEKARKAADASNMDDMVNAIKLYAADGAHHLQATEYELIIWFTRDRRIINASCVPINNIYKYILQFL